MPKFRFVFRPVKYLSERRLRSRSWRLSTRIVEHLDIRFDRWRTLRHFVRSDTPSHLGSCSFSELRLLDVPPALQIVDKCRNCLDIPRHHPPHDLLFLIKVSDLRRSLSASLWSVGCLDLACSRCSRQKKEGAVAGLLRTLGCLERGALCRRLKRSLKVSERFELVSLPSMHSYECYRPASCEARLLGAVRFSFRAPNVFASTGDSVSDCCWGTRGRRANDLGRGPRARHHCLFAGRHGVVRGRSTVGRPDPALYLWARAKPRRRRSPVERNVRPTWASDSHARQVRRRTGRGNASLSGPVRYQPAPLPCL